MKNKNVRKVKKSQMLF